MADFKHPFIDFSRGEVEDKLLVLSTAQEDRKSISYSENGGTTKTKGLGRRTGTIKENRVKWTVSEDHSTVRSISLYVGKGKSFLINMYVIKYGNLTDAEKLAFLDLVPDVGTIPDDRLFMNFDFYSDNGESLTFVNGFPLPLDVNYIDEVADFYPGVLNNDWTNVDGFRFAKYKNFMIFTHESGGVEPFVASYNGSIFEYFLYSNGLFKTSTGYYPTQDISAPFNVPFNVSNLNPDVALRIERVVGSDEATFYVRAMYYDPSTKTYINWEDYDEPLSSVPGARIHPLKGFNKFLRVTIGGNSYVLKYGLTIKPSRPFGEYVENIWDTTDPDYNDEHIFYLVLDAPTANNLYAITASGAVKTTTDFQIESFNKIEGYPDNVIFHQQRLLFNRDDRIFNSNVGNAFFMHQYRFPQTVIHGIKFVEAEDLPTNPGTWVEKEVKYPLLLNYTGIKTDQDAFDFFPFASSFSEKAWMQSSEVLEYGTFSEVLNIKPVQDAIYSFNNLDSGTGTSKGSRKSLSLRAGDFTLFVGGDNKTLRDYYFDGRARTYVSNDLNQLNKEIIKHLSELYSDKLSDEDFFIKEISFDDDNDTIYLVIGPTNALISFRYNNTDGISSWSRVTLGGHDLDGGYVEVHSAAFLRNDTSQSSMFFVTKRDGVFYNERQAKPYSHKQMNAALVYGAANVLPKHLPVYLDFSERQVAEVATHSWTVSEYFFDKTVDVFADGFWIKNVEVGSAGELILNREVNTIVVGFRYKSKWKTMAVEPSIGGLSGSSLDMNKHINHHHLRLHNSYGGSIGHSDGSYLERIPYDSTNMLVGTGLELYTGPAEISPDQDVDEDVQGYIETDAPYPFELLAWVIKGEVNDG